MTLEAASPRSRAGRHGDLRCAGLLLSLVLLLGGARESGAQGFHGVTSRDGIDAWAVGDSGVYYRSLNAGLTWSSGSLGASFRLWDVVTRDRTVLIVGDAGRVFRSVDAGGTFVLRLVPGEPDLRSVVMPNATTAFAAGAGGAIFRSTDGGLNWTPLASGTSVRLNALEFSDEIFGWAVGENGTVVATSDGGVTWNTVPVPTTRELFGVDQRGRWVWVVGAFGTALESVDWGRSFQIVNLKLDAHSDVRAVWMQSADSVYIAGGGGFIRRSVDRGRTWQFPVHSMHAPIVDLAFAGATGFAASSRNHLVISSIDRGTTWRMPTGTALNKAWVQKQTFAGQMRGNTFSLSEQFPSTIYAAMGNQAYRSFDDGETWASFATLPQCQKVNAFVVSPKDTNVMVAAINDATTGKRLVRSENYGQTWTTTFIHDFGEYGIPIQMDADHPDTLYFGGEFDSLFRSVDGGRTWRGRSILIQTDSVATHFRSPCDIVVVPDSSNIIVVADGVTNDTVVPAEYFKSTDGGLTFHSKRRMTSATTSEIPGLSNSRLRNNVIFGTNWGGGGVERSTDYGESWPGVSSVTTTWGTDIARDDPNTVMFATYGGGYSFLSDDGGTNFATTLQVGSNYSVFLRDRGTMLAEQSSGIYKMTFTYNVPTQNAQTLALTSATADQTWQAGTMQDITWNASNVALAALEFRAAPGEPWQLIDQVTGYRGRYSWAVPNLPTSTGRIRVRDAWDASPVDTSLGAITILGTFAGVEGPGGASFALWQNRPNPFTRSTEIGYRLPAEADVDLEVFDLQGQRIASLVHGRVPAGEHSVRFGAGAATASGARLASLPSGVYFYRLRAGTLVQTRRMLYVE